MTNIVPDTKTVSALLPDNSTITGKLLTYPGDFQAFVTPFGTSKALPAGAILIPFGDAAFMVTPTYQEALREELGEKLEGPIPQRTALEILHHCKVLRQRTQEALA